MLTKEVSELKRLLIEKQEQPTNDQPEQLLTIQEAAEFLSLTVPTMYSKVSKGELPVMKRSKRLYFSRTELLDYLKDGRKKLNAAMISNDAIHMTNTDMVIMARDLADEIIETTTEEIPFPETVV